jgi:hypothetical protein
MTLSLEQQMFPKNAWTRNHFFVFCWTGLSFLNVVSAKDSFSRDRKVVPKTGMMELFYTTLFLPEALLL